MAMFKGFVKFCVICGNGFKVSPSRAAAICCSRRCKDEWWSRQKSKTASFICKGCGATFEDYASHADRRIFCSLKCKAIAQSAGYSGQIDGEKNPYWNGGRSMHVSGYVSLRVRGHPSSKQGRVFEHRMVMEKWLLEHSPDSPLLVVKNGWKILRPDVIVHHKNEIKTDNRIENLECLTQSDHLRSHRNDPDYIRKQIAALQRKLKLLQE